MKHLLIAAMLLAAPAYADSSATSSAGANADATVNLGGQAVYIDQSTKPGDYKTRTEVVNSGKYTVRSAPAVQAPSMGSGHPCGLGSSLGISIIGGGATGGATKVDDACLLLQAGATQAGLAMVAMRNPAACKALRSAGNIPANSVCSNEEKRRTTPVAAAPKIPTCPAGSKWDGKGCWKPAR